MKKLLFIFLLLLPLSVNASFDSCYYQTSQGSQYYKYGTYGTAAACFQDLSISLNWTFNSFSLVGEEPTQTWGWTNTTVNSNGYVYTSIYSRAVGYADPPPPVCEIPKDTEIYVGGSGSVPAQVCYSGCLADVTSGFSASKNGALFYEATGITTGGECTGSSEPATTPPPDPNCPEGQADIGFGCLTYQQNIDIVKKLQNLDGGPTQTPPVVCPYNASLLSSDPACVAPDYVAPPVPSASSPDPCIAAGTCTAPQDPCILQGTCTGTGTGIGGTAGTTSGTAGTAPSADAGSGDFVGAVDTTGQVNAIIVQGNEYRLDLLTATSEAVHGYEADKASLYGLFTFEPVAPSCTPYTGTVHGIPVSIDLCSYIEYLRSLIGWLFALYGAWSIYNTVFRARV